MRFDSEEIALADLKKQVSAGLKSDPSKYYVVEFPKSKAPSDAPVWKRFGQVVAEDDKLPLVFVESATISLSLMGCLTCHSVYSYCTKRGTSTMNKHVCSPNVAAKNSSDDIQKFCRPLCEPNAGQKKRMRNSLADMCAEDIRPFHMVANSGFQAALQCAYDIGVETKQRMDVSDLVCVPKTVKAATKERYDKSKKKVLTAVQTHVKDKLSVGSSTDIWTDKINNVSFMSVSLHDIDPEFVLRARTLSCDQFPIDTRHTASEILLEFENQIDPFITSPGDILPRSDQVVVTTDSASNNVGADGLSSVFGHESCKCHKIGTCIAYVLEKRTVIVDGKKSKPFYEFYDDAPEIFDTIEAAKDLVTYSKQSGINKSLSPKLIQHNPARWDGLLTMANSINCNADAHRNTFIAKNKGHKFDLVNLVVLDELVRFLEVFKQASKALEAFLTPSLQLVAFWLQRLHDHCKPILEPYTIPSDVKDAPAHDFPEDSAGILAIKKRIVSQLKEKFKLNYRHAAAAYLNPHFKQRLSKLGIDDALINGGMEFLKKTMLFVGPPAAVVPKRNIAPPNQSRPAKRARVPVRQHALREQEDSDDSEVEQQDEEALAQQALELQVNLELLSYANYRLNAEDKEILDSQTHRSGPLLNWWKSKAASWPILARAVRSILCVPPSSARSENNFSDTGNTLTAKRNGLKPATLNMLMFLRSNKEFK